MHRHQAKHLLELGVDYAVRTTDGHWILRATFAGHSIAERRAIVKAASIDDADVLHSFGYGRPTPLHATVPYDRVISTWASFTETQPDPALETIYEDEITHLTTEELTGSGEPATTDGRGDPVREIPIEITRRILIYSDGTIRVLDEVNG